MDQATKYVRGIRPDSEKRDRDDFYETPPEGTEALLRVETFHGLIWELLPPLDFNSVERLTKNKPGWE